jgi:hypothetical protein
MIGDLLCPPVNQGSMRNGIGQIEGAGSDLRPAGEVFFALQKEKDRDHYQKSD